MVCVEICGAAGKGKDSAAICGKKQKGGQISCK